MTDAVLVAIVSAGINIIIMMGGGVFFMGKLMGRLDIQDVKLDRVEKDFLETRSLAISAAVDANRINRAEADIQNLEDDVRNLRRGIGWIRDDSAKGVEREYPPTRK
jgi:hypothetical protein